MIFKYWQLTFWYIQSNSKKLRLEWKPVCNLLFTGRIVPQRALHRGGSAPGFIIHPTSSEYLLNFSCYFPRPSGLREGPIFIYCQEIWCNLNSDIKHWKFLRATSTSGWVFSHVLFELKRVAGGHPCSFTSPKGQRFLHFSAPSCSLTDVNCPGLLQLAASLCHWLHPCEQSILSLSSSPGEVWHQSGREGGPTCPSTGLWFQCSNNWLWR